MHVVITMTGKFWNSIFNMHALIGCTDCNLGLINWRMSLKYGNLTHLVQERFVYFERNVDDNSKVRIVLNIFNYRYVFLY